MPRAYEKSEKERAKQAREIERRKTALLAGASKYNLTYHIQLNVNNTVINAFYEDTIRRRKRGRPPFGDREECPQRQAWEACLWTFLRKQFMKHDRTSAKLIPIRIFRDKPMGAVVFGWLLEHFELYINNTMDVPAALELFAAVESEIDYDNCKEYWLRHSDTYF